MLLAVLRGLGKIVLLVLGLLVVMIWAVGNHRLMSGVIGFGLVVAVSRSWLRFWSKRALLLFLGWVLVSISPIEVSVRNVPGPPHFAELMMGLPSALGREKIRRGEIVSGGCMMTGFEPKWVLVW